MTLVRPAAFLGMVISILALTSSSLRAQVGTGGATSLGTGTGTGISGSDIYVAVQKTKDVNQTDLERARFLNQANCLCQVPAYVRAVILPSAATRAATVSPSATVSMYVGNYCNSITTIGCCLRAASVPYSTFRNYGISATTSVDQLTRIWSTGAGQCGPNGGIVSTGSGGASAIAGSGGTTGSDASVDQSGTGGVTGSTCQGTSCTDTCTFGQTVWVFIGTAGDGSYDIATATLGFSVDPQPPDPPPNITVKSADEALIVTWTGLDFSSTNDLFGYQVLCTRADTTQVFNDGTYSAAFDSCPAATSLGWPKSPPARTSFVCSDLLPTSATSARIKILENGITYGVGVVAIDRQWNASTVVPTYLAPVPTKNFYYEYRHGDPQGGATGGYCSVSGFGSRGSASVALGCIGALAWCVTRRRQRRRR
jgi:hypothetical protein